MAYRVNILAYDGCLASALMKPLDMLSHANNQAKLDGLLPPFDAQLVSMWGQPIKCSNGIKLNTERDLASVQPGEAVIFHHNPYLEQAQTAKLAGIYNWLSEKADGLSALISNDVKLASPKDLSPTAGLPRLDWQQSCSQFMEQVCGEYLTRQISQEVEPERTQTPSNKELSAMAKAEKWIQTNLAHNFTVEDVASQVAMSSRTLVRRFQYYLGKTPQKYIQQSRLERCKMLLKTTSLSFSQIVAACGYSDENALRRLFKKTVALSPTEYRRKFSAKGGKGC